MVKIIQGVDPYKSNSAYTHIAKKEKFAVFRTKSYDAGKIVKQLTYESKAGWGRRIAASFASLLVLPLISKSVRDAVFHNKKITKVAIGLSDEELVKVPMKGLDLKKIQKHVGFFDDGVDLRVNKTLKGLSTLRYTTLNTKINEFIDLIHKVKMQREIIGQNPEVKLFLKDLVDNYIELYDLLLGDRTYLTEIAVQEDKDFVKKKVKSEVDGLLVKCHVQMRPTVLSNINYPATNIANRIGQVLEGLVCRKNPSDVAENEKKLWDVYIKDLQLNDNSKLPLLEQLKSDVKEYEYVAKESIRTRVVHSKLWIEMLEAELKKQDKLS